MRPKRNLYAINQSPLYMLKSRARLAKLLGLSNAELKRLCAGDRLYTEFDIPKRNGGVRHVENPTKSLKIVQAKIARLLARITPPDFLYCPVKGRCYVTNAAAHVGNRVIRCLDIRKFYPSTPSQRVFWFYRKVLRCERDIAGTLTRLSTYQGHLPTGSPLSPILAYFSFFDVWESIAHICQQLGLTLSVYVDDVTVSGERVRAADLWRIKKLIHGARLRYHKEKAFFSYRAEVTGVIITRSGVVAPNRQHLKLRGCRTEVACSQPGADALAKHSGLVGQMSQIKAVNRQLQSCRAEQ